MNRKVIAAGTAVAVAAAIGVGLSGAYASGSSGVKPQKGINWAVVLSDGTLARHSKDVREVTRIAAGQYRVFLKGNVQGCSYQVTGGDDADGIPPRTYGDAAWALFDNRGVFVETYDAAAERTDSDFYLAVLC
jgi:hypothetical protein